MLHHVAISGASGMVSVHVPRMPVQPGDRDAFRFAYPEFGPDFFPELWRQVPLADRAGPAWRRHDACSACGNHLVGEAHRQRLSIAVDLKRVPPFQVELGLPMRTCAGCGIAQVIEQGRRVESDLSDALIQGFQAARVSPR